MAASVAIADGPHGEPTLLVPYPITGPRDIQASERSTRRYRAVAAHVAPPISDDMASLIEAALLAQLDQRIVRTRRDDLDAFDRLRLDAGTQRGPAVDLLLAGDDILRAADRRNLRIAARNEPQPKLLEPLVAMPYVLMCTAARCSSSDALAATRAFLPRTLAFSGELSASHLAARAWMRHLGLDTLLVPYGGGNTMVNALIAGQIDAAFVALPLALTYYRQREGALPRHRQRTSLRASSGSADPARVRRASRRRRLVCRLCVRAHGSTDIGSVRRSDPDLSLGTADPGAMGSARPHSHRRDRRAIRTAHSRGARAVTHAAALMRRTPLSPP